MALTRKMLESMQLNEAQIQAIIDEHTSVTDAIKKERDLYKEQASRVESLVGELEEEKAKSAKLVDKDSAIQKLQQEFDEYKAGVQNEKTMQLKKSAYEALLKESNIADSTIGSILNTLDVNSIELDDNGAIKDKDSQLKSIKDKWGGFIVESNVEGRGTPPTPPVNEPLKSYTYEDLAKLSQKEYDAYFKEHNPRK